MQTNMFGAVERASEAMRQYGVPPDSADGRAALEIVGEAFAAGKGGNEAIAEVRRFLSYVTGRYEGEDGPPLEG